GALYWYRLGDAEMATEVLEQALILAPRSRRALELLRQIHSKELAWEALYGVLGRLCNISTDDAERGRLTVELAELAEQRLSREQEAEELYAHALDLDSANQKAALALRRLYLRHERWHQLTELLTQEAGREHEPDEMFADMYRAARVAELHLRDDARSASFLETAAALRPGDPLPLSALGEVYQRTGRYEDHAAVLERQLRVVRDPVQRAELHHRVGRINEDWLGRIEPAMEAYQRALSEKPDHEASLRALSVIYRRVERWDDLFELELLRAERFHDDARRADGYLRAAILAEERLRDQRRAVDLYDRAWRLIPGSPEAFRALDRIYRELGRYDVLVELYEKKAELTEDTGLAVSLLRSAATLHEQHLDARDRAIKVLKRLRALVPDDREAIMHLARLYEHAGRAEDLRQVLVEWAELTEDGRERTELLRRVGDLLDGPLRETEAAIEVYQRILDCEAADRPARERLKGIFERLGRWDDLADTIQGELEVAAESDRAALQLALGRIAEDKLGDIKRAELAYEASLAFDAQFTPAMLALEELLKRQARWEPLVRLLLRQAESMRQASRASAALCRAAEIEEAELGDSERASEIFHRALELDRGCGPARQGLERLYLAAGDYSALEEHYLREAEVATNPVLRVRAYLRLATLFDGVRDDVLGATAAYESALKAIEDQPDALHALASLARRTAKWDRLAELLGRLAATAEDRDAAVAALKEWAAIIEVYQADQWDPEPIYQRVLDGDPLDPHALAALDDHAYLKRDDEAIFSLALRQAREGENSSLFAALHLRAATVLIIAGKEPKAAEILRNGLLGEPTYLPGIRLLRRLDEELEEWREAAQLLLREGEIVRRPAARHAALARAGNILLDRFDEVDAAHDAFSRVFDEDPKNGACFGRLVEILAARREWRELVVLYDRRMAAVEGTARGPLLLQLADIYRDRLDDGRSAVDMLVDLLEADPQNVRALEKIAALCIEQQRWREAEGYLARLAEAAQDDAEGTRSAMLDRSDILEKRLGDEEGALKVLQDVLARSPGQRVALARSMAIYRRWGDWDRTVETLEELSRTGPPEERIDGLVDLAE
ncbi:MAG: tetratricopeptide repeat protein, partial [Deltaproteobacteria bacterium]|nr:tetratricopeptide repeat protein [Deltaproteobacteria bacterium]